MITKLDRYQWSYEDWRPLLQALKRPNTYRYALLAPEPKYKTLHQRKGRSFETPFGWLHLSKVPREGHVDLTKGSIRVGPLVLYVNMRTGRIQQQANRQWVRGKLKLARAASRPYWKGSYRRSVKEYLAFLNALAWDVQRCVDSGVFIQGPTVSAFNSELRRIAIRTLTSVYAIPYGQAKQLVEKYLHKVVFNRHKHNTHKSG